MLFVLALKVTDISYEKIFVSFTVIMGCMEYGAGLVPLKTDDRTVRWSL